ncbi:MAG: cysteine hydrolase [Candidatus Bathyarchaeota archaeon]|nr:cysteine hydrolase [Candidatus Bathyarchaeota archaeon]MCX8177634.1 cysteine hydrolase [Candidatus Bathyarchaeota archaeon]MDW8193890.1 isochorismatase family cysteine hydrolase [Nitrososphaerota archaeon]
MFDRMCVIIIDMLNDFVIGELKCDRALRIVPGIKKLLEAARRNNVPVIYCNDAHYPHDFEVVHKWGGHAVKGTKGAEVISELKPSDKDFIVEKRTYSGFFDTGLDSLLRSFYGGDGAKTLILCGIHTHICVKHTAADAFFRGYKIVVARDGVEAFTQEDHEQGLRYMEYFYNAKIMAIDDIVAEIEKQRNLISKPFCS